MKNVTVVLLSVCCLAELVTASPKKVYGDDGIELMETKLTKAMDHLNKMGPIAIYGDMFTLEKIQIEDPDKNLNMEEDPLISRVDEFLKSRKIKIKLPSDGSTADLFGRALGEKNIEFELRGLTTGASEGEKLKINK